MKSYLSKKADTMLKEHATLEMQEKSTMFSYSSGKVFKFGVVLAWLAAVYNTIMFTAQVLGLWINNLGTDSSVFAVDTRNATIILIIIIASDILLFFKKYLLSSSCTLAFAAFYIANTSLASSRHLHESIRLAAKYMYMTSTIIAMVVAVYLLGAVLAYRINFSRTYNKILAKITATSPTSESGITNEAEWEERIENYFAPAVHKKPKKSLRKKQSKEDSGKESK